MGVIDEIAAERKRQIEVEGWTHGHDEEHADGEMLRAAVIYFQHAKDPDNIVLRADGAPMGWPWDAKWWKPKGARRDLVRAGALCQAEKERLARQWLRQHTPRNPPLPSVGRRALVQKLRGPTHHVVLSTPVFPHVLHKFDLIVAELERLDRATQEPTP